MCGGRGTRLDADREKPLVPIAGIPMIDRVLAALAVPCIDRVVAAVSPQTPATGTYLRNGDPGDGTSTAPDVTVVETPGDGYVADLDVALDHVETPALTLAADLPLLDGRSVSRTIEYADGSGSVAIHVPAALKRGLGCSVDRVRDTDRGRLAPTGCNLVGPGTGDETIHVSGDPALAVNVNRDRDRRVAAALLRRRGAV